jgi:hypothetical protein
MFGDLTAQDVLCIAASLGLTKKQGELVVLLITRAVVTAEMVEEDLAIKSDFRIVMHRLNHRLRQHGITARSHYGIGYTLAPEHRARLYSVLRERSAGQLDLTPTGCVA